MDGFNHSGHHTNSWFLSGEYAGVDIEAVEDWKEKLHQIKYPLSNQVNLDEIELFYWQVPRKELEAVGGSKKQETI
jgi:hypothetical protein